jgi:hypothetical protein
VKSATFSVSRFHRTTGGLASKPCAPAGGSTSRPSRPLSCGQPTPPCGPPSVRASRRRRALREWSARPSPSRRWRVFGLAPSA